MRCHSRQPRTAQARIPGASDLSLSSSFPSISPSEMVCSKGTRFIRRHIPADVSQTLGRWFTTSTSLWVGSKPTVSKSWCIPRAWMRSPPVRALTRLSFKEPSLLISDDTASRAPRSVMSSVGWDWYLRLSSIPSGNGVM